MYWVRAARACIHGFSEWAHVGSNRAGAKAVRRLTLRASCTPVSTRPERVGAVSSCSVSAWLRGFGSTMRVWAGFPSWESWVRVPSPALTDEPPAQWQLPVWPEKFQQGG